MPLPHPVRRPLRGFALVRAVGSAVLPLALLCAATAPAQTISTLAGGATCDNASAQAVAMEPAATAVDASGNVYVAISTTSVICKIAPGGAISRYAGTGTAGFGGDGGQATAADLGSPSAIAIDTSGSLYIADSANNRIRKVTPAGTISTIAGDGNPGFSGDGDAATSARLNYPAGLTLDAAGALYFSDSLNQRVRKIAGGTISTIAGNGTQGYSGDGGAATSAQLASPWGVAVDSAGSTVYVADRFNQRIRKIAGGTITTIAGSGTGGVSGDGGLATAAQLYWPHGVVVDAAGNLYVADTYNHRIRKVTAADGKIATIAGSSFGFAGDGGAATAAKLNYPQNLAIDGAGNIYIADYFNYRVRKIDAASGKVSTLAGNGTQGYAGDGGAATSAQLGDYLHVAADAAGNLYISDANNHRIRKVATDGTISTVAGNGVKGFGGDGGPAVAAKMDSPNGIALDNAGNLYIADQFNQRIRKVATNGTISTIAGNGNFDYSGDGGPATSATLGMPAAVTFDGAGNLYIADSSNQRIRRVATDGTISTVAGNGTQGFGGDGGLAINANLNNPGAIVFDRSGQLNIADTSNHRVRRVAGDGSIATIVGTGSIGYDGDGGSAASANLELPTGLARDRAGNLHIADWYANSVRKIDAGGTISRIAGSSGGRSGFGGDGGAATDALLRSPHSIAFDAAGNLYIADSTNRRIRKVAAAQTANVTGLRVEIPASAVYGESVVITVTVGASLPPTGKVDVCLDGDSDPAFFCWPHFVLPCSGLPLSPSATPGEYVATCTTSTIPVGDHSIAGYYSDDNSAAVNLSPTLTIAKAATTIAVTSIAPGSIVLGQPATVTVGIGAAAPGAGTPTGIVTISDGTVSCSYSTPANDNCSITPSSTGAKSITASYSGDGNFLASTTVSNSLLVNSAPVDAVCGADNGQVLLAVPTQLCSVGNASAIAGSGHPWSWTCAGANGGGSATCSATIKTWTVSASAGANGAIAPAAQTVDHGKTAALTVTPQSGYSAQVAGCGGTLAGATYTTAAVTADCAVGASFTAIPRTPTMTTLSLAPNPVTVNQTVTAILSVSGGSRPSSGSHAATAMALPGALTGTVVVSGGGQQCMATLDGNGAGSCALTYAAPGTYAITASYSGDTQNAPSNATANLTVNATPTPSVAIPAPALSWWAVLTLAGALAACAHRAKRKA
ncbi:MAG: Ig-like domain repeat protein [Rudaea sp.]|uniref:NHL domain-containing protein n=1 Tax=unclassified Rudaea TaxID=2627037 RepID=UPI0010F6BE51|nr:MULTISPECIES: Ig-like domain repeat protein [unclassified Rudaea]MBN8884747.1 Ig-like domain repeat protein [Rudaea sp.]